MMTKKCLYSAIRF